MTQPNEIARTTELAHTPSPEPRTSAANAMTDAERQRLRALLYDSVLDGATGDAETLDGARPELRDRAQDNEDYVKTFRQPGGE